MGACYECDYNNVPFEEMIKIIWGEYYGYSNFAREKYIEHGHIFLTSSGKVYGIGKGELRSFDKVIKTSTLMKDIEVGKL
jgi:hypothetical protein